MLFTTPFKESFGIIHKCLGALLLLSVLLNDNAIWGQAANNPDSSSLQQRLYIHYNFKPDSIFIDGQLLDSSRIVPNSISSNKLIYNLDTGSELSIRSTLWACNSIEKKVQARSRVTIVKLDFELKPGIFDDYGDMPYKELPIRSTFGHTALITKRSMSMFFYLTPFGSIAPIALSKNDNFKAQSLVALSVGAFQLIHGAHLQRRRWRGINEQFHPLNITWTNWRVNLNFASLHGGGRNAVNRLEEVPLSGIHTSIERIKIDNLGGRGITVGLERKLGRDLFASANISFAPSDVSIQFDDTIRYGATKLPNQFFLEKSFPSLIADLQLNYTFLRLLNHEWSIGLGGFWGNSVEVHEEYSVKKFATFEEYDTTYVSYKFEQGGLVINMSIRTLLSPRLGYHFRLNYVNSVSVTIKDEQRKYKNVDIHVGFFYQL